MKIMEMKKQLCNNNIRMHNIIHKSKCKYIIHIPSPRQRENIYAIYVNGLSVTKQV